MLEPILIVGIVMAGTAWYVQHKWRRRVRAMFTAIAPSYDLNNRLHSLWIDQHWRRVATDMAIADAVQASDMPIKTPAPSKMPKNPPAVVINDSPAM